MSFLNSLVHFLEGNAQAAPQAAKAGAGVGAALGGVNQPDFTYNPNQNTNVPNSSHNLQAVQLYPGHGGVPMSQMNIGQGVGALDHPQLSQGNQFNPGYTPLQNSGLGPISNLQGNYLVPNYPQDNQNNPQRSINLY